jgi:ribose 5-phosphate isomerase B
MSSPDCGTDDSTPPPWRFGRGWSRLAANRPAFRHLRVLPPGAAWDTAAMRVFLGSDHAGFELKSGLIEWLAANGHEPVDCGPGEYAADDDYPPFVLRAAARTAAEPGTFGIVIGGSGNGEIIAANKVRGIRAALVWSEETAALAREHNDANVMGIGARMHDVAAAQRFAGLFLSTPYSKEDRHTRRIDMISHYEATGQLPSLPPSS